jgi:cell division protease FtsH
MSEALGTVSYDGHNRGRFLEVPFAQERAPYGEDTARAIDAEIKHILTTAQATARSILSERRSQLENVTRRLLVIEVMDGDELRQLLGLSAPPPPVGDARAGAEERVN